MVSSRSLPLFMCVCFFTATSTTTIAKGVDLSPLQWSTCEEEIHTERLPRSCFVLAVGAMRSGYKSLYHKIEDYCLKYVADWLPLDQADRVILANYFPKCFYRSKVLESAQTPKLNILDERNNLVRFLYMDRIDGNPDTNEKRLPNHFKARSGP